MDNVDFIGIYMEEIPEEIDIPIGDNNNPVAISLPTSGGLKIIMPESSKERKGVINPKKGDEVPIIFKPEKPAEECVGETYTIRIFNLLGEQIGEPIIKIPQTPDDTWTKWSPPEDLASGIYIIHVGGPGVNTHKKIPILR